jgi:hypothetical protein
MSNDHFVAQTYLRHFGDPKAKGILHAYRKTDGKEFPCWPKDVCAEWEGDLNDWFPDNPGMLGEFRKIFEPYWNPAVRTILEGSSIDPSEKFALSGYIANLMVCTPAWRRIGQQLYRHSALTTLRFKNEMLERRGEPDLLLNEGLQSIDNGGLEMTVDPGFIKAKLTQRLMNFACLIYNLDWLVVKNETEHLFVTSDNPVAMDFAGPGTPMRRLLPITPRLCLSVKMEREEFKRLTPDDMQRVIASPPKGRVYHAHARAHGIRETNKLIVQCADELVFSSAEDSGIRDLTRKYAKFGMDIEFMEHREPSEPNALYSGFVTKVRERPA